MVDLSCMVALGNGLRLATNSIFFEPIHKMDARRAWRASDARNMGVGRNDLLLVQLGRWEPKERKLTTIISAVKSFPAVCFFFSTMPKHETLTLDDLSVPVSQCHWKRPPVAQLDRHQFQSSHNPKWSL